MALARTASTRVVLSQKAFASLTMSPTGDIHAFCRGLARDARMIAYINAPSRTGELRRKIQARVPKGGITYVSAIVECTAPHAKWVHEGTSGGRGRMTLYARPPARPDSAMIGKPPTAGVPGNYSAWRGARIYSVRGQEANPFLRDALDIAKRRAGL